MEHVPALLLLVLCGLAIISPQVHTGVSITLGLGCFVVASFASLDDYPDGERVVWLMAGGAILVVCGLIWDGYFAKRART